MSTINHICQIDIDKQIVVERFASFEPIIKKFSHLKTVKDGIKKCLQGTRDSYNRYGWIYESQLEQVGIKEFVRGKKVKKLFVEAFPKLVLELNIELNAGIDIMKLTHGSNEKLWWNCLVKKEHPPYQTPLYDRTRRNSASGCPQCGNDRIKIALSERKNKKLPKEPKIATKEEKESHIKNYVQKVDNTIVGDETEIYIEKLIFQTGNYSEVERIGHKGDHTDIIITLANNNVKCLQVKTLIATKKEGTYNVGFRQKYDQNMLVAMVNKERDKFALAFVKEINVTNLSLPFNATRSKYKQFMYTDKEEFLRKLIELIPDSVNYTGFSSSKSTTKEYESLKRLETWCTEHKLDYTDRTNNGNSIDCYINKIAIQAKFCLSRTGRGRTYKISTLKTKGTLNGKDIKAPYNVNDSFEYIVAEIGGPKDNTQKYRGYFCFIPKKVLIEQEILAYETCKGKTAMHICPPDYPEDHWSKQFWYGKDNLITL